MARKRKTKSLAKKPWAFLAYIAGDNDLSPFAHGDLQEMTEAGASPKLHCGLQIDSQDDDGSIRYEITERDKTGKAHHSIIERLRESDSGAPETLVKFLKWGFQRYPAERRLVVVWSHGSGFRSSRADRMKDIAPDESGSTLDIPELVRALRRVGADPKNRIAILGLDACLMNMVEIVHHLRECVEVVVGSEQTEPKDGWPYKQVLAAMRRGGLPDAIAKKIVESYIKRYKATGDSDVTQSAVHTDKTDAVVWALGELGNALVKGSVDLSDLRMHVQSYEAYTDYVDLKDLAVRIAKRTNDAKVRSLAHELAVKTKAAVIANDKIGRSVKDSHGLSVWFPDDRTTYLSSRKTYIALDAYKCHHGWVRFLDRYHRQSSREA